MRCDKAAPSCSSCRKSELECFYQAPLPRRRKRKLSNGADDKLLRYERILKEYGLLPPDQSTTAKGAELSQEPISLRHVDPISSKSGKLITDNGKSRYIDGTLWSSLGDDGVQQMSDDEEEHQSNHGVDVEQVLDPLTGAFLGCHRGLLQYHPTQTQALALCKAHAENVEPICRILHIPTTTKRVEMAAAQLEQISRVDECQLFAIYHSAIYSMSEEECSAQMQQSRSALLQRYHFAARQALVNASFLKTMEFPILQALVLLLLTSRYFYDPHTYWILAGVAVRISQRLGLHREGEKLGLPPFDVQMRRRLFYQILRLDGVASSMSGSGISWTPGSWDTEQPLNINEDQIWPGMEATPREHKGATDMIYVLARACVGKVFMRAGSLGAGAAFGDFKDHDEVESVIAAAENEVEDKFIRYCDVVNPLHFLTIGLARSAISAMRLRAGLTKARNHSATDADRSEMLRLSHKILDADSAAFANPSLRRYLWHVRPFFAYGTWDSLIFILTTLRKPDSLSMTDKSASWSRLEQVYKNHNELLRPKGALHIAIGRLMLRAWDANPNTPDRPNPSFILSLRSLRKVNSASRAEQLEEGLPNSGVASHTSSSVNPLLSSNLESVFPDLTSSMHVDTGGEFAFDPEDWVFWDNLIKDYQAQGG